MQFSLMKQEAFLQGLATLKNLVIEPNCWRPVASLICTYCSAKLREIGYFSLLFTKLKSFTLLKPTASKFMETPDNWIFTTIASNLVIWLANLPLSIRVQTTLHTSTCHAMPFSALSRWNKHFFWCWYCGKKQIEFGLELSVLLSTTILSKFVVDSRGCAVITHTRCR